mmetsp:Transcript_5126/g.13771  ORF Transcript_5126/g.13771 Transcript_5126/m.13771 type:complete len:255 (+) Transcript_5126:1943-2707(+)
MLGAELRQWFTTLRVLEPLLPFRKSSHSISGLSENSISRNRRRRSPDAPHVLGIQVPCSRPTSNDRRQRVLSNRVSRSALASNLVIVLVLPTGAWPNGVVLSSISTMFCAVLSFVFVLVVILVFDAAFGAAFDDGLALFFEDESNEAHDALMSSNWLSADRGALILSMISSSSCRWSSCTWSLRASNRSTASFLIAAISRLMSSALSWLLLPSCSGSSGDDDDDDDDDEGGFMVEENSAVCVRMPCLSALIAAR